MSEPDIYCAAHQCAMNPVKIPNAADGWYSCSKGFHDIVSYERIHLLVELLTKLESRLQTVKEEASKTNVYARYWNELMIIIRELQGFLDLLSVSEAQKPNDLLLKVAPFETGQVRTKHKKKESSEGEKVK